MDIGNSGHLSALEIQDLYLNRNTSQKTTEQPVHGSFQDILNQRAIELGENGKLKFSRHAENRLSDRNIELTGEQLTRLKDGCERAGAKGIKESLMVMDSLAFIVSVPNRTVITAMDQNDTKENIFTNIDGAVFV